jgi:hypothetical protein
MIGTMGHVKGSDAGDYPLAHSAAGAVVPRLGLFEALGASARATVVSAPAGTGKTVLLRSWISQAAPPANAAWVPVERDERDPQRFWLAVLAALRRTGPGPGHQGDPRLDRRSRRPARRTSPPVMAGSTVRTSDLRSCKTLLGVRSGIASPAHRLSQKHRSAQMKTQVSPLVAFGSGTSDGQRAKSH